MGTSHSTVLIFLSACTNKGGDVALVCGAYNTKVNIDVKINAVGLTLQSCLGLNKGVFQRYLDKHTVC